MHASYHREQKYKIHTTITSLSLPRWTKPAHHLLIRRALPTQPSNAHPWIGSDRVLLLHPKVHPSPTKKRVSGRRKSKNTYTSLSPGSPHQLHITKAMTLYWVSVMCCETYLIPAVSQSSITFTIASHRWALFPSDTKKVCHRRVEGVA